MYKLVGNNNKILVKGNEQQIIDWFEQKGTLIKYKNKRITLSQYLKDINRAGGYVDRRKDHWRVKTRTFTPAQLEFLNSIQGITAENKMIKNYIGMNTVKRGIIRTDKPLREKLIKIK